MGNVRFQTGTKLAVTPGCRKFIPDAPPLGTLCSVSRIEGEKIYFRTDDTMQEFWVDRYTAERMYFFSKTVKREQKEREREEKKIRRETALDYLADRVERGEL